MALINLLGERHGIITAQPAEGFGVVGGESRNVVSENLKQLDVVSESSTAARKIEQGDNGIMYTAPIPITTHGGPDGCPPGYEPRKIVINHYKYDERGERHLAERDVYYQCVRVGAAGPEGSGGGGGYMSPFRGGGGGAGGYVPPNQEPFEYLDLTDQEKDLYAKIVWKNCNRRSESESDTACCTVAMRQHLARQFNNILEHNDIINSNAELKDCLRDALLNKATIGCQPGNGPSRYSAGTGYLSESIKAALRDNVPENVEFIVNRDGKEEQVRDDIDFYEGQINDPLFLLATLLAICARDKGRYSPVLSLFDAAILLDSDLSTIFNCQYYIDRISDLRSQSAKNASSAREKARISNMSTWEYYKQYCSGGQLNIYYNLFIIDACTGNIYYLDKDKPGWRGPQLFSSEGQDVKGRMRQMRMPNGCAIFGGSLPIDDVGLKLLREYDERFRFPSGE